MNTTEITKEKFLAATIENISQVYHGKRNCCRCGCGGEYIATSFMASPRSEVNDSLAAKRLKRAQELIRNGADYDSGYNNFDVETGENRTLTFYFDDLKSKQ